MQNETSSSLLENVQYNGHGYRLLEEFIVSNNPSKVFILVDSNTHNACLPLFLANFKGLENAEIIEIEPGEEQKTIETCNGVWGVLSELGADRKSLVINLGGGVVTDLGGFVASTFRRGITYINVPTTLLAMVDAAIGGKTGVGLGHLKNQIGVINPAAFTLIDSQFLKSLDANEMRSGLAEILKHGLIQDEKYWQKTTALKDLTIDDLDGIIKESIQIKLKVVSQDPNENGLRKTLNFGHTLGHAIESYFLGNQNKTNLLHGEAVAAGMLMACYISKEQEGFPETKLEEIKSLILSIYEKIEFTKPDIEEIIALLKYDKKNEHGNINFVLLQDIGIPVIDCRVSNQNIEAAFAYYKNA